MLLWIASSFCQEVETGHDEGHLHFETKGAKLSPGKTVSMRLSEPSTTERFMLKRLFGET